MLYQIPIILKAIFGTIVQFYGVYAGDSE